MIKYRICRKQVLHKDLKLVEARKVLSDLNENNDNEELVYELEKYNVRQPKRKTRQLVKDKSLPNLNYMKLK